MNDSPTSGGESLRPGGYSPDCIDVFYDGPANTTKEPISPGVLELLRATRETLIRHGAIKTPPKPDGTTQAQPAVPTADNSSIRVPLDPALLLRLHGLSRPIELIDENGKAVAVVTPLGEGGQAPQNPHQGEEVQSNN